MARFFICYNISRGELIMITENIREVAINEYRKGLKVNDICKKYSLARSTVYYWIGGEKKIHGTDITYADYKKLKNELSKKTRELEIYLNLHCFRDSTTKEKEQAISKFIGVYPTKVMCRLLDIPVGTFYNYHFRRAVVTQYQMRDDELKKHIFRIFEESDGRFGASKIWIKLKEEGVNTTKNKIRKLMRLLNICSTQKLRKCELKPVKEVKDNSQYYINKLKRAFKQNEPNKFWVGDVTEVRVKMNKFYLCVILDLFSRKIVAYRLSSQNNTQLTINTFKDAYEDRGRPKGLSFHSDQGCNYTAFEYRDLLRALKVTQSFSKSGNPYDNACIESFFSNFKREEYNSKHYEYFDELEVSVASYMRYYNDYRPHQTLKNKTPNQFEKEFYEKKLQ